MVRVETSGGGTLGPVELFPPPPHAAHITTSRAIVANVKPRAALRRQGSRVTCAKSIKTIKSNAQEMGKYFPVAKGCVPPNGSAEERGVVLIVKVAEAMFDPSRVTEPGEISQVALLGAPVQARVAAWLNPPTGESDTVAVAELPAATVRVVAETDISKSRTFVTAEAELFARFGSDSVADTLA